MSVPTANTYAVMSFGGFLGLGKSCHPLPWHVLTYDPGRGGYVVDLDKDRLRAAPSFTEGDSPDWGDRAWAGGIDAYYADRPDRPRDKAAIDDTVDDSFPASDPPSWSGGATGADAADGPDGNCLAGGGLRCTGPKSAGGGCEHQPIAEPERSQEADRRRRAPSCPPEPNYHETVLRFIAGKSVCLSDAVSSRGAVHERNISCMSGIYVAHRCDARRM